MYLLFAYKILLSIFAVVALFSCLLPGLTMLFFPSKAFRTATKPRWLGIPVLALGVWF